jgi:eukaryotic-like serine/threonine-protein kinase
MSEESLFLAALEKSEPADREAFLNDACGTDRALRARVQLLLDADARARGILDRPVPAGMDQTGMYFPREQPGTVIAGRYKLLEAIGEGGMGTVWVAEQTEPVRRKVALKLIKAGMDSRSVLARFEAERQALAVMDHPNIAKVLDGGLTEAGRPFFVMEYVKGVPITEYCDATRLNVPERLNLFVQVCQAVQHAHQKGIIHRDLKPSNILVAPYDDKPVPKVIDFGLAKAMHQSLTERTLHTAHETVLGTPLYMSPEQAQLNNLDVDTRSDVYSLGVLLYELLTGTTPLEKQRFKQAAWEEIKRIIREEEPPRPSLRLSSTATLPSLAAGRHTEPERLTKLVRGELDWIVMKSLEKDRARRYETANGFAADIQRYLSGEPVLAAPPSARYRLRKFARKYRAALSTAAAIALLLVTGAAVSTWQAVRATNAEAAARVAEQKALQAQRAETERAEGERLAKLDAEAKRAEAERQQARAEAGEKLAGERLVQVDAEKQKAEEEKRIAQTALDFLQNKLLSQADVQNQANSLLRTGGVAAVTEAKPNPTIRELLDRAAEELTPDRIDANFPKQPLVQAQILHTVGNTYRGVGEYKTAIGFLERSVALRREHLSNDDDTLSVLNNLAAAYLSAEKADLGLPLFDEAFKLRKAKLGPDHASTLKSMVNLAYGYFLTRKLDLAVPLYEEALQRHKKTLGLDHPSTLNCMAHLAGAYLLANKVDLALPLFEETLKRLKATLGPHHPATLNSMANLAGAYKFMGKLDLAAPLFEEALRLEKAILGPDHPHTLYTMSNLAATYHMAKNWELAAALQEEVLKHRKAKLGADHSSTLLSLDRLSRAYKAAKKMDLALPLYEEILQVVEAKHGREHPDTLKAMYNLAAAHEAAGKLDLALPLYQEALTLRRATLGPDHSDTIRGLYGLGSAYQAAGKWDLALPLYEEALKQRTATLGPDHRDTLASLSQLTRACREAGDFERSLLLFQRLWESNQRNLPADDTTRIDTQHQLGLALVLVGRFAEAEPHLLASYRDGTSAKDFPKEWPQAYALRLIALYAEWGKAAKEAEWMAKWQADLDQLGSRGEWQVTMGLLMLQATRFRAAEVLLQDCLDIREKAQPDHWTTFNAKSMLGGAFLGQKKYADAEPLLLAGYEGMKQRETKIAKIDKVCLSEAAARLVQLYEALDKTSEAAKWRNELEE